MRRRCNVLKRALAVLFAFAMIASGICFIGTDANKVYATEPTEKENTASAVKDSTGYNTAKGYFVKEYEDISIYKTTDTYPILDETEYTDAQDWLFAGWYTSDACTASIGTTESGTAWAKFVHIDVLSVKCQIEKGTDADTDKTNMRLISTLDSLKYDTVGFKVKYNGGDELDFSVSTVFKRIKASEINGNECGYSPSAFHETSEYFVTYSLLNIANKNFSKPFYIEPYWITLDGTEVRGASRFARVEDRYLEIVNVPVRLHADATVKGGSVTVNYGMEDEVLYGLYAIDEVLQYDNGTVFNEVTISDNTTTKVVTVTATEEAEAVSANGMLVNLRFQMIADTMPSTSIFEIISSDFNVSDFIFKNFPLTYSGGYDISWYTGYEDSDTFVIASAADLYGLAALSNGTATGVDGAVTFANKTIYLASDITINEGSPLGDDNIEETDDDWATTAPNHEWTPIGKEKSFAGVFDGQGNTVSGIYLNATEANAGMFAQTTTTSTIQNISIKNSYMHSTKGYMGSVVGYSNQTKLMNIYSDAYVIGDGNTIGGIVGGVVGASQDKNISSCWFDGTVTGDTYCGGIVGRFRKGNSTIKDCLVTGSVVATSSNATASVGGIVGGMPANDSPTLGISTSISAGSVTGGNAGGVIGYRASTETTYATLTLTDIYTTHTKGIGTQSKSTLPGYATDTEKKKVDSSILNGHIAYDTIDGFSFLSNTNMEGKWVIRETAEVLKDGIPIPKVFAEDWIDVAWYYKNVNTTDKTLTISTAEELYGFSDISRVESFDGCTIQLSNDIVVNTGNASSWVEGITKPGRTWSPIGKLTSFAGTFDGQGNTISGIYVNETTENAGLFATTADDKCTIQDIGIKNSYIYSTSKNVGSIVGKTIRTKLINIYSDACVESAGMYVGGLVGYIQNANSTKNISSCWFNGDVTGSSYCGGIVGCYNYGKTASIMDSLVTGTVQSTKNAENAMTGGIVGGTVNPTTYGNIKLTISSCVSVGAITEGYTSGDGHIGGVIGYRPTNTDLVVGNVYTTQELGIGTESDTNKEGVVANCGVDSSTLNGHIAYDTIDGFGFLSNTNPDGKWVIRETAETLKDGVPVPKVFADEWIDVAWYYENVAGDVALTISTPEELYGFADISQDENFSGETVQLANDITANVGIASETAWVPSEEGGTSRTLKPIGKAEAFAGTFNGNGNTISGIYVNEQGNTNTDRFVGLFGRVTGTVQDFKLENSYIQSKASMVGSVVGFFFGNMQNVYSSAYVNSSNTEAGGLVGRFGSTESNNVISQCWFAGTVTTSAKHSGGIVGRVNMGTKTIRDCLNSGSINSSCDKDANVGGIVGGVNDSADLCTISDCLSVGSIITDATTGIGSVIGNISKSTTIKDTYSTIMTTETDWERDVETVVGIGSGSIVATNTTTLTGIPREFNVEDIEGANAYFNTDLEFKTVTSNGAWIAIEGSTPELAKFSEKAAINTFGTEQRNAYGWYYNGFVHSAGARATKETYTIMDKDDLFGLAKVVNGEADVAADTFEDDTVVLGASITVSDGQATKWAEGDDIPSNPWTPIGKDKNTKFAGLFDGNRKSINGLYMNVKTNYPALFGHAEGCTIRDLKLENSCLKTTNTGTANLGSIIGYGYGTLENIYSDAILHSSGKRSGGLVGTVMNNSTITSCWYDGDMNIIFNDASGNLESGGLLGIATSGNVTIENCLYTGDIMFSYASSSVSANPNARVGGICGADYYKDSTSKSSIQISDTISAGTIEGTLVANIDSPKLNGVSTVFGHARGKNSSCTNVYTTTTTRKYFEATDTTKVENNTHGAAIYNSNDASDDEKFDINVSYVRENLFGLGAQVLTVLDFEQNEKETIWAARRGQLPAPAELVAESDTLNIRVGKADTSWLNDEINNGSSEQTPYILKDVEDIYGFAIHSKTHNFAEEYIRLSDDIEEIDVNLGEFAEDWENGTASSLPWYSIGTSSKRFAGHFDGNDKTISGIYMNQDENYLGLFAATETGSTITNLRLTNSYFNYTGNGTANMGSIVGDLRGDMTEVYSDAIINSNGEHTGGLVAVINETSTDESYEVDINNCWYNGKINSSKRYVGGLVATVKSGSVNIENSLNTCVLNSTYSDSENKHAFVGGLCGRVEGRAVVDITDCIASGQITDACGGLSVRSTVGYIDGAEASADVTSGSTVNFVDVFATKDAYGRALPNKKAQVNQKDEYGNDILDAEKNPIISHYPGVYTGTVIRTHKDDRLIGYCTEEVGDGEIVPSLDFATAWTVRTSGVPVPSCFAELELVKPVEVAEGSTLEATLNAQVGLDYLNTELGLTGEAALTLIDAINMGEGNYVLDLKKEEVTVEVTQYNQYINKLQNELEINELVVKNDENNGAGADGVHSVSLMKRNPDWVLTLTYVETTKGLTISINTDSTSLSDNLVFSKVVEDENYLATGNITLTMLQLNESKGEYAEEAGYYYGNSFVLQLPNGHFIINDGGEKEEFVELAAHLKNQALNAGLDKVYVDAWIVSHQHGDHFDIIKAVVDAIEDPENNKQYIDAKKDIYVDAFYISEPNAKTLALGNLDGDVDKQYYGMTLFAKENGEQSDIYRMHTGQRYYFHGVIMDVIQAQEQIPYDTYAKKSAGLEEKDFNTASTVVLFTTSNNQKIFIGGDANYVNMQYIMDSYGANPTTLSNIDVFVALHHGKNTSMKLDADYDHDKILGIIDNEPAPDNSFTDYLITNSNNTEQQFDVVLFPCSVIYDVNDEGKNVDALHDVSYAFPQAGEANVYLLEFAKDKQYYHYGNGTKEVILSSTGISIQ